ncbi:hypothetical protein BTVI_142020 [Pitangus sulphuratus]|nr:hypothetical protein BTVI_142020 [Pitangus sulphuratus]
MEEYDCESDKFPVIPKLVQGFLLHMDPYKSMGPDEIISGRLKELSDVIVRPFSMFLQWSWEPKKSLPYLSYWAKCPADLDKHIIWIPKALQGKMLDYILLNLVLLVYARETCGELQAYGGRLADQYEKKGLKVDEMFQELEWRSDVNRYAVDLGSLKDSWKAQEGKKKVVVAGCVPQAQPRQDYLKGLSIIGVQQIDRVVEVVEETIKGHSVRLLGQKKDNGKRLGGARLDLPKIRKNPLIEIISINTGHLYDFLNVTKNEKSLSNVLIEVSLVPFRVKMEFVLETRQGNVFREV